MPQNENLKPISLPMELKFNQEPRTIFYNNLRALKVELVDAHHPDLFDGPPYVTLRCKRSGVWCTVGSKKMLEGHEWEPSTWYFPDGIFGDGWVKVSDIWEGIEPPAPQLEEEELSSKQTTLDEYTDKKVQSEKTESGAYRVSWGGLGKKKEAKE